MLVFVPEATFTQQLIMYSFFIGTPLLLCVLIGFLGYQSVKQNMDSTRCPRCAEFVNSGADRCWNCENEL